MASRGHSIDDGADLYPKPGVKDYGTAAGREAKVTKGYAPSKENKGIEALHILRKRLEKLGGEVKTKVPIVFGEFSLRPRGG